MEKAKITLIALFLLVGSALVFVFRYNSKKDQANKEMMAKVRDAKISKKYVQEENQIENEEIKSTSE